MIVQFVLLHILRFAVTVFESIRYWCDAVLVPLCYYFTPFTKPGQKIPKNVAVIVKRDVYVEKTAAALQALRVTDYTLIVEDPKNINNKQLSSHLYVKGSYPKNMLKDKEPNPTEYDLVVSFQDRLDLCGLDARCIGFSTFAVVPCVCSFFIKLQLTRALAVFGECRQNYGK